MGSPEKERAAKKVAELAKALILADNHFLSAAVGRLDFAPAELRTPFATDGCVLAFDADKLCAQFKDAKTAPKHDLLHAVLHCVFVHPYVSPDINARLWNVACDIAVERNVAELCGPRSGERGMAISDALNRICAGQKGVITAEKIYHSLCSGNWAQQVDAWETLFFSDDHALWYGFGSDANPDRTPDDSKGSDGPGQGGTGSEQGDGAGSQAPGSRPGAQVEKAGWNRVAKALAVNLQTYAKARGKNLTALIDQLEESAHERVDYGDFLRQFATPGETLRLSEDEFDYIFYTYGILLYGNLPLIEPLEYREEKRIREFVIVIDTSGSVQGEIVRAFIDTTFDILKSTEAFFERVHVRIIQCDAQVQSDDVVTSLDELKEWGRTMKVYGGGGTDFRPAFDYVDGLVEAGAFENLGGLVYFTDGWGAYPDWMPEYKTAFVFYDEDYRPEDVPTWAAQIVLDESTVTAGSLARKRLRGSEA